MTHNDGKHGWDTDDIMTVHRKCFVDFYKQCSIYCYCIKQGCAKADACWSLIQYTDCTDAIQMRKEIKMKHVNKLWVLILSMALAFGVFAMPATAQAAKVTLTHTKGKNASDVKALKKLIKQQKDKGVKLSTDMDGYIYTWDGDGRLTGINWYGLKGTVSFSGLPKLQWIVCDDGKLTGVDVTKNTELTSLECGKNKLSSLDVTKNTKLGFLACSNNNLKKLDVSKNPDIVSLYCDGNKLTSLDVSKCTEMGTLACNGNKLESLNISKCAQLRWLTCYDNNLKSLDVSKNTILQQIQCKNNQITGLDLSNNTALYDLDCDENVKVTGWANGDQ